MVHFFTLITVSTVLVLTSIMRGVHQAETVKPESVEENSMSLKSPEKTSSSKTPAQSKNGKLSF